MKVGASEAEPFWTEFLRSLNRRGLRGVKLVISDSHEGIKAAVAKVLNATWQRCRVHTIRTQLHASADRTAATGRSGPQWNDMANLQGAVADDDALDDELQDCLLLRKGRLVQARTDARAERLQVRTHGVRLQAVLA
jgi:transposase-like protein